MSCSRAHILHELGLVSFQETFSEWQFVQSLRLQWLGLSVTHTAPGYIKLSACMARLAALFPDE